MPKSKQRKNHKKKVNSFKRRNEERSNRAQKMQQMFMEQLRQNQEHSKREHIIETILNSKPELAVEVENTNESGTVKTLQLNTDVVDTTNGVLSWKEDGNPLLAGLEPLENYSIYTEELVNAYLSNIHRRKMHESGQQELEVKEVVDVSDELGTSDEEFVVEDPSYNDTKD